MSKFSPGPWRWIVGTDCRDHLVDANEEELSRTEHMGVLLANQRLIAAAPEMYELLRMTRNSMTEFGDAWMADLCNAVDALLARIDGSETEPK